MNEPLWLRTAGRIRIETTMVLIKNILDWAIQLTGKPYVFGTEQDGKPKPNAEDCSELVQNACDQNHVVPRMPDGAVYQMRHCRNHGTLIGVKEAMKIRGALLFRISGEGNHVAFYLGNGMTFEARGRKWGVGSWSATWANEAKTIKRIWTHAGLIPGVEYEKEA